MPRSARKIAVALQDIEPARFERCALIRDWLDDHGVDRATLLVIPARDLHPVGERSPDMVDWLLERRRLGDSIAQHGFRTSTCVAWMVTANALPRADRTLSRAAEFVGLDAQTRRAVQAGWRLLKLAGIEPDGFVAPAYAYTPALRRVLGGRFRWWASVLSLHGTIALTGPAGASSDVLFTQPAGADTEASWRRLAPAWTLHGEGPVDVRSPRR